jgi:hydroxymethylbilane synthase
VKLRIGTRGSRLALAQAEEVITALRTHGVECELVPITTSGDRGADPASDPAGLKGLFVAEIVRALRDGDVDLAVHSAKDLPAGDEDDVTIAAVPERASPLDVLVTRTGSLEPGARVGTSSVRRQAQVFRWRPDVFLKDLRGNVDTRLRKRGERGLDAVVLAACGLERLGLESEIDYRFEPAELLPEAGQGALALQVRMGEEELVSAVDDAETRLRVEAERRCVAAVGGGCLAPVAAHHDGAQLAALVADEDGRWVERLTGDDPEALGLELADAYRRHAV